MNYDIIIIGAGAAGLAAACHVNGQKRVLILEKNNVCGKKLAITGGGRCNFANTASVENQLKSIRNGQFLKQTFRAFSPSSVQNWFSDLGVQTVVEEESKIFSANFSARQIADKMLEQSKQLGCEILYNSAVKSLLISDKEIGGVVLTDGSEIHSGAVIVCTGGNSYQTTGSNGDGYKLAQEAGHQITTPCPALTSLETSGLDTAKVSGVVVDNAKINLFIDEKKTAESSGILLFTHTGISGPAALSISGRAVRALNDNQKVRLELDLYPEWNIEKADAEFQCLLNQHGKKNINNILSMLITSSLADLILNTANIPLDKKGAEISGEVRRNILKQLKRCSLKLTGYKSWKEAMVTAGGVSVEEISGKTMESKLVKGLYFAGEVINIDGDTGGFNLQAAFSTGVSAIQAACKK